MNQKIIFLEERGSSFVLVGKIAIAHLATLNNKWLIVNFQLQTLA